MKTNGILFLILCSISHWTCAQTVKEKCERVPAHGDIYITDSLTIVPSSIRVTPSQGVKVDPQPDSGRVRIHYPGNSDSLQVCYSTLPYSLNFICRNRPMDEYDSGNTLLKLNKFVYKPIYENREEIFHSDSLTKSGAISRGISFGNNQDLYVNSVFNLQMQGKLSESLNVRASITDQNIPYQPEGNTVLVQDFDNVYIELYNKNFSLLGGDMQIRNENSYFLQYRRNVMGARFSTHYRTGKYGQAETSVTASASKGRFSSFKIEPQDGVLGPYRLYGPGHEKFIIILANSEKVYLDGQLLQRGYDNDYIIDYNTAEITFTSSVLITRYSRIVVDFQYNDQSYGRSLITASHDQQVGKLGVKINYYREKDDPSRSFSLPLSDNQKMILRGLQDSGNYGLISGADSAVYDPGKILYKYIDTIDAEGRHYSVYQYTGNPDSAVFQVFFTETGSNKGNYRKQLLASGLSVYVWVPPAGGTPQGNYDPVRKVPLPEKKQMVDIETTYDLSDHEKISGGFAVSDYDNNLFSRGKGTIPGHAFRFGISSSDRPVSGNGNLLYEGGAELEYSGNGFRQVDRFRAVEFDRDWSYDASRDSLFTPDLVLKINNGLKGKKGFIRHQLSRRIKQNFVEGWQNTADGSVSLARFRIAGDFYYMNNTLPRIHSDWLRYHVTAQYDLGYFVPGYRYTSDRNVIHTAGNDSISGSDLNYDEHMFFIKSGDSLKTRFNIQYMIRKDRIPYLGEIIDDDESRTFGLSIDHGNSAKGKIGAGIFLRKLSNIRSGGKDDKSLNGKLNWDQPLFDDHMRSELSYSIGSGRELKREYTYIEVPGGQGTHTWRDDNQDGVKDLDEFYPAINADERNYIRIFIPTDDYIQAYDNILNYRLTADMPRKWANTPGIGRFFSRFSNVFSVSADQKKSDFGLISGILDNSVRSFDPGIISQHARLRNTLYFNRRDPGFGMDLTYDLANAKNLFTRGFEGRSTRTIIVNSRINIYRQYTALITYTNGQNVTGSDYLSGRNFMIISDQVNTNLSWQPAGYYRFTANLTHTAKKNTRAEGDPGSSVINEAGLAFRLSRAEDKAIECRFRYSKIAFNGDKNSPLGYELLNGLQPGNNILWSLTWQQKLLNGLRMNIIYDGRKSGDLRVIHTGRMQVTALF